MCRYHTARHTHIVSLFNIIKRSLGRILYASDPTFPHSFSHPSGALAGKRGGLARGLPGACRGACRRERTFRLSEFGRQFLSTSEHCDNLLLQFLRPCAYCDNDASCLPRPAPQAVTEGHEKSMMMTRGPSLILHRSFRSSTSQQIE